VSPATRLHLKLLWLRSAWSFNWAHKPLCERFREDVLRLGGLRLCRSCACAWGGILLAVVGMAVLSPMSGTFLVAYLVALGVVLGLSLPPLYKRLPRVLRDLLRMGGGGFLVVGAYVTLFVNIPAGLAALAALVAFWWMYFKMRRKRKLRECDGCPELANETVCSGFALQAEHVRRYEEAATELLTRSGAVPGCLRGREEIN